LLRLRLRLTKTQMHVLLKQDGALPGHPSHTSLRRPALRPLLAASLMRRPHLPDALAAAEARHVAPVAVLEPSARAAADAARRDHLALVEHAEPPIYRYIYIELEVALLMLRLKRHTQ
jgi:hypothetical protein